MAEAKGLTPSEVEELAALRAEKIARERKDAGIEKGKLICNTPGCDYGEKVVDCRKVVAERKDAETGLVENSVTYWFNDDPHVCDICGYALALEEPGAVSAFPAGYRYQYPEPIR